MSAGRWPTFRSNSEVYDECLAEIIMAWSLWWSESTKEAELQSVLQGLVTLTGSHDPGAGSEERG